MNPESLQVLRDLSDTKMAPSLPQLREAVRDALKEIDDLEARHNESWNRWDSD